MHKPRYHIRTGRMPRLPVMRYRLVARRYSCPSSLGDSSLSQHLPYPVERWIPHYDHLTPSRSHCNRNLARVTLSAQSLAAPPTAPVSSFRPLMSEIRSPLPIHQGRLSFLVAGM